MVLILQEIESTQLSEKYTACELVEALDLDVTEVIDTFEDLILEKLEELLDKERGIGL